MGYDDRRSRRYDDDDDVSPYRGREDRSRSGAPSRPRGDTPPRSGTPSRPRSGDTPPRSGTPSRPRSGDTPPRSGSPSRPRGGSAGGSSRDAFRRVRDGLSSAYEAVSREVRSLSRGSQRSDADHVPTRRRDEAGAGNGIRSRSSQGRAPAPRDDDYAMRGGYSDDEDDAPRASRRGDRSRDEPAYGPAHHHPVDDAIDGNGHERGKRQHSLAMRLRNRRRKLRGPQGNPALRALGYALIAVLLILIIGGGGFATGYSVTYYQKNAALLAALSSNRSLETTSIYSRDGVLLYSTFGQNDGRRDYLTYCQIPELVKRATVDTEDATFWGNIGIEPTAIVRALATDLASRQASLGASTITQQLIKNGVLNDDKTIDRKANEAILAVGLTQHYTKQQILTMYLNTIFYSNANYGIEAAAQNYFGLKQITIPLNTTDETQQHYIATQRGLGCVPGNATSIVESAAWQLQPWQATLLVGIPQSPSYFDPLVNADNAITRQSGVMGSMDARGDDGYLCPVAEHLTFKACADGIKAQTIAAIEPPKGTPLQIYASANQTAAGQITTLAPYFVDYVLSQLNNLDPNYASDGWNVYTTIDYGTPGLTDAQLAQVDAKTGTLTLNGKQVRVGLQQYAEFSVRQHIEDKYLDDWYCPNSSNVLQYLPLSDNLFDPHQNPCYESALNLKAQNVNDGALTAIDPKTGDILAMVGGVDYNNDAPAVGGQNNVAISTQRSMGSAFKPIVYATSFQMGWYPGMIINDQPVCFPNTVDPKMQPANETVFCPNNYVVHNFDYDFWSGPIPIANELGNSLNSPATQTLSFVGSRYFPASPLIPMAQRLGITSLDPRSIGPSTALGAQGVPLLQLTEAYGTFANNGYHVPSRSILAITDIAGNDITTINASGQSVPLVSHDPLPGGQAISPQAAYMITSILTNNDDRSSDFGPHNPLHFFGRDVAAKTGTSQDLKDIVTAGYTPWLALGVWCGNADDTSMNDVIGITGAGYIFHDVMSFAIAHYDMPGPPPTYADSVNSNTPGGYFPVPPGLHLAEVNCQTGLAPWKGETTAQLNCDPATEKVPLFLSPFFVGKATDPKPEPLNPNQTWWCRGFGCKDTNNGYQLTGMDITWMMNGDDPATS